MKWLLRGVALRSVYDQRRALLGFGLGLAAFAFLMGALWPTVQNQAEQFQQLLDMYPPALLAAFDFETFDAAGFVKGEMYSVILPVLFLIYGIARAAEFARDEETGVLDIVLSHPIGRTRLLLQRMLGLALGLLVLTAATSLSLWLSSLVFGMDLSIANIAAIGMLLFLLCSVFSSLAFAAAAAGAGRGWIVGGTAGAAAVTYILLVVGRIEPSLDVGWVSPFHYYSAPNALANGLGWGDAGVLAAATLAFTLIAVMLFRRRDLNV